MSSRLDLITEKEKKKKKNNGGGDGWRGSLNRIAGCCADVSKMAAWA